MKTSELISALLDVLAENDGEVRLSVEGAVVDVGEIVTVGRAVFIRETER